jgi:hypothetical protein
LVGLYVGISPALKDKKVGEMPKNIGTLFETLGAAQISAQLAFDKVGTKEEDFYLVVGNAP